MSVEKREHILMIDDDREDAFLMKRALKAVDENIEFQHIIDSEVFVKSLQSSENIYGIVDVLLVDLNMRGMDGFDVIKAVRDNERTRNTNIVMLTSSDREEDRAKALAMGANRFATKPNTIKDMSELARSLVN